MYSQFRPTICIVFNKIKEKLNYTFYLPIGSQEQYFHMAQPTYRYV